MDKFVLEEEGVSVGDITVRLAKNETEIALAQKIRYHIFYEEFHAKASPEVAKEKRDFDDFDDFADHLVVIDNSVIDKDRSIVGTYRLMGESGAHKAGRFYTSVEFNISTLLNNHDGFLEMGRSCVLPEYRTKAVLQLLWLGIAEYVAYHKVRFLFGCASFHGTDPALYTDEISYLYHNHLAPIDFRPTASQNNGASMNMVANDAIDVRKVMRNLPPLIKGYLRIGGVIGDGLFIDEQFDTVDVCVVLSTSLASESYLKHFERKTSAEILRD